MTQWVWRTCVSHDHVLPCRTLPIFWLIRLYEWTLSRLWYRAVLPSAHNSTEGESCLIRYSQWIKYSKHVIVANQRRIFVCQYKKIVCSVPHVYAHVLSAKGGTGGHVWDADVDRKQVSTVHWRSGWKDTAPIKWTNASIYTFPLYCNRNFGLERCYRCTVKVEVQTIFLHDSTWHEPVVET